MKRCKFSILALAAALSVACSDIVEPFYTQSYEIGRVSAAVVLEALPAEEGDEAERPDPAASVSASAAPDAPAASASASADPDPEAPVDLDRLKAAIEADVLAASPVAAGGGYRLEYVEAFAGPLTVYPAPDVPALTGTFAESTTEPAFVFRCGDRVDSCRLTTYDEEGAGRRVLLTFDLTRAYQEQHPEVRVVSVVREEYTLRPAD